MLQPSSISAANSFHARIGYGFYPPPTGAVLTPFAEASHAEGTFPGNAASVLVLIRLGIVYQLNCSVNAASALRMLEQP